MDLIKVSCWCTAEEWAVRCDTVGEEVEGT